MELEPGQLSSYLAGRGWEVRTQAGEDVFKTCPFCQDERWKFYVNPQKNVFYCQRCKAKGGFKDMKAKLGDDAAVIPINRAFHPPKPIKFPPKSQDEQRHQELYKHIKAIKWLKERGLKEETIKHFKLGYYQDDKGLEWINIPYYEEGKLVCNKRRSLPPAEKTFRRTTDAKSTLFNMDCLSEYDEIILTEGEFDAMMVWQAGHNNVVSVPNGATKNFDPEWIKQLQDMGRIYLWYDNDKVGIEESDELVERLGVNRCFLMRFKGYKDANEYLLENDEIDFSKAKIKKLEHVFSFQESATRIFERRQQPDLQITTPWPKVNKLVYSIEPGDLITLSATPKIGKTTLALNIATHNAKRRIPALFFCLEMRHERLSAKIVAAERMIPEKDLTMEIVKSTVVKMGEFPLYFGSFASRNIEVDKVFDTMDKAIRRYGIKLLVFDHLHFLVRSLAHTTQEIGILSRRFKLFAEEMSIPIILIAQPRKVEDDKVMSMLDLKDSSSIGADSDQVIVLFRKKLKPKMGIETEASYAPDTLVRVDASRFTPGGDTMLYYRGEICRFFEEEQEFKEMINGNQG